MAEFKLEFGAVLEGVTGKIDEMGHHIVDGLSKVPLPRYFPRIGQASSATSATTPFTVDLGGPPVGFAWDILGITTCGVDDHSVVAGAVALYCGALATISVADLKVPSLVIPTYDSIGKNRIWCQPGQELFANVSGVANGSPVTVIVHVAEWRQCDVISQGAP
jgi:hypothetical protein